MGTYIIKKILILLFLLWAANSLIFVVIRLIPGDPATILAGTKSNNEHISQIKSKYNLDSSILNQYVGFMKKIINFDFGESYIYKESVSNIIFYSFPNTLYLAISAMFISILISFPLGILSALNPNSKIDVFTTIISSSFLAIPNFLLASILIFIFSVTFKLLPVSGSHAFKYIILPTLTLGLSMTAFLTKIIRASFYAEMGKPYVLFAKAKGMSQFEIIFKHVFKNASIPVLTVLGLQFGTLISGVIITETIFSWQGIGTLFIDAIKSRDYPLIQGIFVFILFLYLLIHMFIDLIYLFLEPKIRFRKGRI